MVSKGLILNQRNVGLPKQCYKLACYFKLVAINYDKTHQQQQHHFSKIFLPQNTVFENFAFHKVHLPNMYGQICLFLIIKLSNLAYFESHSDCCLLNHD